MRRLHFNAYRLIVEVANVEGLSFARPQENSAHLDHHWAHCNVLKLL